LTPAEYPLGLAARDAVVDRRGGADHPNVKEQQDNAIVGSLGLETLEGTGYA
jgi:hypothetical protein